MKHLLRITLFSLLALAFSSCIFTGSSPKRTLGHVYQDSRGFHIMTLFESGSDARGTARTIGLNDADRPLLVSTAEFERMWSTLEAIDLSRYKLAKKDEDRFNAADNYVITKGFMRKGGTETYVVPHSEATPALTNWVVAFRSKAKSE